ncbi:very short patch repair endonuclease [Bradyrhizobium sp. LA7.1]|uniref:very short patch repair endonuclease n=1 Tax=Bradyrhizobium sp. LA7.1 TaxID=3156324 RepID=UPI0033968C63
MVDIFTREKRSEIMARVKGRNNAATELLLARTFRRFRVSGWRRGAQLFGRPDFIFKEKRLAVFVDGCFWHGCPLHGGFPKTNRSFWRQKLTRNSQRDREVNRTLRKLGWTTLRIWQHELRTPERVVQRVRRKLSLSDQ